MTPSRAETAFGRSFVWPQASAVVDSTLTKRTGYFLRC
jgi:hypothetical protein